MITVDAMLRIIARTRHRLGRLRHAPARIIDAAAESPVAPGTLVFRCSVCAAACAIRVDALEREGGQCGVCGSSMRFRSLVHHLSLRLFGRSLAIAQFPPAASRLRGAGMSDTGRYAELLAAKVDYTNTFYHKAPQLDIRAPGPEHLGAYDFVISSDVFEHVTPPVSPAFRNLRSLLRPGGVLVLTVPFAVEGETAEHFPELHEYAILEREGAHVLVNRTVDGREQRFADLVFHGGPGSTLEMRLFSEAGLRRELEQAGFADIRFHREPGFEAGIYWSAPWSVPITALAS